MQEGLFRNGGHRVTVEGQKRQLVDPGEGLLRQSPNQVEAEIQNLEKDKNMIVTVSILYHHWT